MTIRYEEKIRDKLEFYKQKNKSIHLTIRNGLNNYFRNGKTLEIYEDHIIFIDEVLGEIIIFLEEIKYIAKRLYKK